MKIPEKIEEEIPFFITEEKEDSNWNLHKNAEKELNELIINSGLLSEETAELKIKNTENLNKVYEKILEEKKNNPNITDEELSELYSELTQYIKERTIIEETIIEETILKELEEIKENTQENEKSELANYLSEKLTAIQEKRSDFNYIQNDTLKKQNL